MMVPTRLEADTDDSDQKKTKTSFPLGLVSNWHSKVSTLSQTVSKAKASELNAGNTSAHGGLDDEDTLATFTPTPLTGTVASNRKNDVRRFYQNLFPMWQGTDI